MNNFRKIILAIIVLLLINIFPKFIFVEKRMHLDELIWEQKGMEFIDSVVIGNWKNTRLSTRPAVTVEWLSGASSLIYRKMGLGPYFTLIVFDRIFFISLNIVFSLFVFFLLLQLYSFRFALASSIFLSLYPSLNNFSEVVWTDSILMWMQLGTILCFLVYRQRDEKKFLYLSGILFGLAILTKIIAWLIPILLILIIFIMKSKEVKREIKDIAIMMFIGIVVFYILYPASWFNPFLIFDRSSELELAATETNFSIFYYLYSLFNNDPALTLFSLLLICFIIKEKVKIDRKSFVFVYIFSFYIFILTVISYFKDSQVENIASVRYYLPAIPFLILFFTGGVEGIMNKSRNKIFILLPAIIVVFYIGRIVLDLYFVSKI